MENDQPKQLSNKEIYDLKRQEKIKDQNQIQRKQTGKQTIKIIIAILIVGGSISGLGWYFASRPPASKEEVISRRGIHWHPELTIYVKGIKQEIPANIGIGITHKPIHTHDSTGVLHLEFQGLVRQDDVKLGRFFENWGKDFMEFGSSVQMMVNGNENTEFQNYIMKDGDKIELRYEQVGQ